MQSPQMTKAAFSWYFEFIMLELGILNLQDGVGQGHLCIPEESRLDLSPSGSQPLGSSEWVREETENKNGRGRFHVASLLLSFLTNFEQYYDAWSAEVSQYPWKIWSLHHYIIINGNEQSYESCTWGLPTATKPAGLCFHCWFLLFF